MKKICIECRTPMDEVPLVDCATHKRHAQEDLEAPAPDGILDLHQRVAAIVRRRYLRYTSNQMLAHETAMEILEEVTRTYQQIADAAGEEPN